MNRGRSVPLVILAAVVLAANVLLFVKNPADLDRLLINVLLALSAFVTLHARLLSLANAGFMAVGAYASAILVVKAGWPLSLSLPGAVLVCGVVALVIGLPVLRLSDVYLAIATLGFGEVVRIVVILNPDWTGGPTGANLSTGFSYEAMKQTRTWMLWLFLALLIYLFHRIAKSRSGRAFRAIRENPSAASTMGINVVWYRNLAFVMSAMIAGAAGVFYAHTVGSLDNSDFKFNRAVDILSYAVLGGASHWLGPILGAGVLTALPIFLRDVIGSSLDFLKNFVQLPNILDGLALMLAIVFLPGGLIQLRGRFGAKVEVFSPPNSETIPVASSISPSSSLPLLSVEDLTRSFGGINALSQVNFEIHEGRTYGLIGPNGAGKTTLINVITGLFSPTTGRIVWKGAEIHRRSAHEIAEGGIARTYQNIRLFGEMTVLENVIVGHHSQIRTNLFTSWFHLPIEKKEENRARNEALVLLDRLGLLKFASIPAGKLSYGDQRRVEIARALAQRPQLLLLDEPAAGMNDAETQRLAEFLMELKKTGMTLVIIEHHMDLIMGVSDELIVLNFGRKIAQGDPRTVSENETVIEAYLGRD
jgi:branched-chain amino acid transport system permease protein